MEVEKEDDKIQNLIIIQDSGKKKGKKWKKIKGKSTNKKAAEIYWRHRWDNMGCSKKYRTKS